MNADDKSGSPLANTGDLAYMGEPLIIVTASSILDICRGPRSVSDIFFINYQGLFDKIKFMFISKLNSRCVLKYRFHGSKKLLLVECFEKNKIAHFLFVKLLQVRFLSVSCQPTARIFFAKTFRVNRPLHTTELSHTR